MGRGGPPPYAPVAGGPVVGPPAEVPPPQQYAPPQQQAPPQQPAAQPAPVPQQQQAEQGLAQRGPLLAWTGPPARPGGKAGTLGRKTKVFANHFAVEFSLEDAIMYDVDIVDAPPEEGMARRPPARPRAGPVRPMPKALCRAILKKLADGQKWRNWVYDGQKALYVVDQLQVRGNLEDGVSFTVSLPKDDRERGYVVTIKHTRNDVVVISAAIADFIRHGGAMPQDALQVLDTACRHKRGYETDWVALGRSFLNSQRAKPIGAGLEVWFGYQMSLRPTQSGLALVLDRAAGAFLKEGRVLDLVLEAVRVDANTGCTRANAPREWDKLRKFMKGVMVARNTARGKRTKRVITITERGADQSFFPLTPRGEGGESSGPEKTISVADYYKTVLKQPLRFPKMPCLSLSRDNNRPIWVPMESATVIKGQRQMLVRDPQASAAMIKETAQHPDQRWREIEYNVKESGISTDPTALAFGLRVSPAMKEIDARILAPPTLLYANNKRVQAEQGGWNLRGCTLLEPVKVNSWALVVLTDGRGPPLDAASLLPQLTEGFARAANLQLNPRATVVTQQRNQPAEDALRNAMKGTKPQIILVALPDDNAERYRVIKTFSDQTIGVPTQCMLAKHLAGRPASAAGPSGGRGGRGGGPGGINPQYLANVALKINAKMGGRNSGLFPGAGETALTVLPFINDPQQQTIVFGADVSHPPPGSESASISALVASMDVTQTRYAADLAIQTGEMIGTLDVMARRLLIQRFQVTRVKPTRILYFRDGVSEGQFSTVIQTEANALLRACNSLEEGYRPRITFVVVQKRHNTRMFVSNAADADRSGNVPAGTVIDTQICHPTEYDFYLMSHSGLQGTSRPVHYHVLLDEIGIGPDAMQTLCYRMCYLYCRATKSVSLVPPVYYAHLAAARGKILTGGSEFGSDTASAVSGAEGGGGSRGGPLPVHKDIALSMYWA